jgi:hypothetical protein
MPTAIRSPLVWDTVQAVAGVDEDYTVTRPFHVAEVVVQPRASPGGAVTTVLERQALGAGAFNAVTNAMVTDTLDVVARPTSIIVAQSAFDPTDVLRLNVGAGVLVNSRLFALPRPIAGAG